MARQRRGGFRPPELRGTLGTLLRTTLEQAGVVRDAISRGARSRFDEARSHRRRQDALVSLGELVLDLIRRGEIDLAELPEARDLIQLLDDLDASSGPSDPDDRIAQPPTRGRFDARPPVIPPVRPRHDDDVGEGDGYGYDRGHPHDEDGHDHARPRARRASIDSSFDRAHPHHAAADDSHDRARPRRRDEDVDDGSGTAGTVSATRGSSGASSGSRGRGSATRDDGTVSAIRGGDSSGPGTRSGRAAPPKPTSPQRVWRPSIPDDELPPEPPAPRAPRDARAARRPPADPPRQGGIQFDDDEDLADYMHPDDVPPKPPTDDDR